MARRILTLSVVAVCLSLLSAVQTRAQANLAIVCQSPTVCSSGPTTLITLDGSPLFDIIKHGPTVSGTVFIAVLQPNTFTSFTVTGIGTFSSQTITFSSGHLGASGNLNRSGMTDYEFSALVSAASQAGVVAADFEVTVVNLGAALGTCGNNGLCIDNVQLSSLPAGTVIVAWIQNGSGTVITQTPLSGSLTVIPEPASVALFGTGLVALGGLVRRRLRKQV